MATSSYLTRHTGLDSIASTLADRLWANYSIVAYVAWLALILRIVVQLVLFHTKANTKKTVYFVLS